MLTDYEKEQYFRVLHPVVAAIDPPSWPATATPAVNNRGDQWKAITDSPPLRASTSPTFSSSSTEAGEDWQHVLPPQSSSSNSHLPTSWWQQDVKPAGGNRADTTAPRQAVAEEQRSGNGHQSGSGSPWPSRGPSAPAAWPSASPVPSAWSDPVPSRADGGAAAVAEPLLANQLRQLAASALPFTQASMEAVD